MVARLTDFYAGKRVFITGHTGFKGAWLWFWLKQLGADVTGYSLEPPSSPSLWDILGEDLSAQSIHGDVADQSSLIEAMQQARPDVVFHMAAQSLVRESYESPVETFSTNLLGTVHVLEAARQTSSIGAVVIVTTDKCYENNGQPEGYLEDDRLGGSDPYSASKACAELATTAYARSFYGDASMPGLCSVRAGNVIGGGDFAADRLLPDMARSLSENEAPVLRHPEAHRPWQYVLDLLAGYLDLAARLHADKENFAGSWNFGPRESQAWPVGSVADTFCSAWANEATWKQGPTDETKKEAAMLQLNSDKARSSLGWTPLLDVAEAIEWSARWYKAFYDSRDMTTFTRQQLEEYMERANAI